ncbi:MAG TPA: hypothetical protein VNA88_10415 [Candidatus Kapabacteria bacterium]|nr:hypothetical protein [Candidatus Kapabacteria bacterium]
MQSSIASAVCSAADRFSSTISDQFKHRMSSIDASSARSARPQRPIFQRFVAWSLASVGALFALLSLTVPSDPTAENQGGETVILVFGLMMLAGGVLWLSSLRRREQARRAEYDERAVLAVAARHGGRATVAQITLETDLSSERAEQVIDRLCGRNIAQPDILDDGTVVYQFGLLAG